MGNFSNKTQKAVFLFQKAGFFQKKSLIYEKNAKTSRNFEINGE